MFLPDWAEPVANALHKVHADADDVSRIAEALLDSPIFFGYPADEKLALSSIDAITQDYALTIASPMGERTWMDLDVEDGGETTPRELPIDVSQHRLYLSGKAGAGKDTIADILWRKCGFRTVRIAAKIKYVTALVTRTSMYLNYCRKDLLPLGYACTLGQAQILVGRVMRELYGPEIWIETMFADLTNLPEDERVVVVDVRTPAEARYLEARGVKGLRIERDRSLRLPHIAGRDEGDVTETGLDGHDFWAVVQNDDTLEALEEKCISIVT